MAPTTTLQACEISTCLVVCHPVLRIPGIEGDAGKRWVYVTGVIVLPDGRTKVQGQLVAFGTVLEGPTNFTEFTLDSADDLEVI